MYMHQDERELIYESIQRVLPVPEEEYYVVIGDGVLITDSFDQEEGEDVTFVKISLGHNYDHISLHSVQIAAKHLVSGIDYREAVVECLLEHTKRLGISLVVVDVDDDFFNFMQSSKLGETFTWIESWRLYDTAFTLIITDSHLKELHNKVAKNIGQDYRLAMYTREGGTTSSELIRNDNLYTLDSKEKPEKIPSLTPSNTFSKKKEKSLMDKISEEQLKLIAEKTGDDTEELRALLTMLTPEGDYRSL